MMHEKRKLWHERSVDEGDDADVHYELGRDMTEEELN
jgi:hypothetical protein